ncbi:MAG TPA: hypothetical protein VIM77_13820 [Mucilaginibacter sp.]
MKLKLYHLLFWMAGSVVMLCSSCKEFIEPSISKKQIFAEAPADGFQSTKYTVNFWWDEVEEALGYRLQVVSPGFDAPAGLVLDTVVKGHTFTATFDPGNYEWRVRAENGSSETAYTVARKFTVASSTLKGQTVTLGLPANNTITSNKTAVLNWNALYGATNYRVQVDTNNFTDDTKLVYNQTTPGLQLTFTFAAGQTYGWRVRAENDTEQSNWSAVNYITYKINPPGQVTLTSPADNAVIGSPVTLQWNTVTGAAVYKLYVYKSDGTTLYSAAFPLSQAGTSYTFNMGATGEKVYWKVSAVDASGNEGKASTLRSFTIL